MSFLSLVLVLLIFLYQKFMFRNILEIIDEQWKMYRELSSWVHMFLRLCCFAQNRENFTKSF